MRLTFGSRAGYRFAVVLMVVLPWLVATGAPASASPPSNDNISNATVITNLPFHDIVDLSGATFDPSTDSSGCSSREQTVWYSFTPASSEHVAFDPSPSNQTMIIDVFTGSPEALSFVGCGSGGSGGFNRSGFILDATAGTTYWIKVSPICCVDVPTLDLSVYLAVAPQVRQPCFVTWRGEGAVRPPT
jgi:hypothetical protein